MKIECLLAQLIGVSSTLIDLVREFQEEGTFVRHGYEKFGHKAKSDFK